jgi:uncharacterized delta-60 repeat protein
MNQKTTSYLSLLALLALAFVLTPRFMSAQTTGGTLDTNFGTGGKVTSDLGGTGSAARAVAVQPDGKIVAAGVVAINGVAAFGLARYNPDGTLDPSFGTGGTVTTAFDFVGSIDRVFSVVLQPDGKIVVAGSTVVNLFANFALARFNANGTLDASFGTGGIVTTGFGVSAEAFSVAVQADGKIVAAGYANLDGAFDFAVVRYNSNGTLDASFGTGGKVTTAFALSQGFSQAQAFSVAVQPDGRIIAAGNAFVGGAFDFALARFNSNGTLDTGFGTGGQVMTDFAGANDQADSVAVQPDGKIVVAGQAGPYINRGLDFALARYNSNGTLDTSFGTSGKVTTDFAGSSDMPSEQSAVVLQGDGKIVMVGQTLVGGFNDFALARYNINGTLDTSFGTSGRVTTDFAGANDVPFSVALQPDGNIVVVGGATINGRADFALARYVGGAAGGGTPAVSLSAATLNFKKVLIGRTSSAQTITLTNSGNATLNISGISANLDYHISTKTCGATLAAGANCAVSVTFTPTAKGARNGTLTFNDNAPNSPQTVALSGTGQSISLSPAALNFGIIRVGVTSASQSITVSNVGPSTVTFTGFALAGTAPGDYLITANTCAASIAPAASCSVRIAFKPTTSGTRNAKLNVNNNGGASPAVATLTGSGN